MAAGILGSRGEMMSSGWAMVTSYMVWVASWVDPGGVKGALGDDAVLWVDFEPEGVAGLQVLVHAFMVYRSGVVSISSMSGPP